MKSLAAILKPTQLKEDVENTCEDAFACLDEIITMCNNLIEGLQDVDSEMDESMMECISSTREHIKSACDCALEAYGFDACCDTCKDDEEEEEQLEASDGEEDPGISKDDETEFHKKLDDLVHSTFGKRMDEAAGSHSMGTATVTFIGSRLNGKKVDIFHKFPDGRINVQYKKSDKKGDVINLTLKKGQYELNEAKQIAEPEEAGLKDYVMPKSVIKMIAKHQFNRVKAGTKLFDAVSKVDKAKDLLHLYTSKKHKNILIGMFMIGEKASFFIHDTDAKSKRLDNVGRYKDIKGFVAALTNLFDKNKNESVSKSLGQILAEADKTPHALAFIELLKKHDFTVVPKDHPFFKKYNKDGKLLGLYAIQMRAGKYADTVIGVTSELDGDSYFVADAKQHKTFANIKDVSNYIKAMVEDNSVASGSAKNQALHPDLVNAGFKSVKDTDFAKHWNPTDRKVISMYVHPESKTLLTQTDYQKAPYSVVIKGNAKEYIKKSVADYTAYKAAGGLKESIELKKK